MEITIRRAQRADAEPLLELITALAHYERLDPPDAAARSRLIEHAFAERPRFDAWLAEADGAAVGYAIAFETYSTFLARPTLYLEDIFVLPAFRQRGIGGALFSRLVQEAAERGCGRMEWACLDWNEPGLRFYRKIGARPLSDWRYFRLTREDFARLLD